MSNVIFPGFLVLLLVSCNSIERPSAPTNAVTVYANTETAPVSSSGDAADDPAIWINSDSPGESRVLGTDKDAGVEVYDLEGNRLQFLAVGRTNNIDLRYLDSHAKWSALAAASNRSTNSISLFVIDHAGVVHWLPDSEIATGLTEPYGLCMFGNEQGLQVFVNDTDGRFQQWLLYLELEAGAGLPAVSATRVREFRVPSQPEGCVADDANEQLFLGVENEGVRVLSARHDQPAALRVIADIDGNILVADVEGMSLYEQGTGGYLVVSSQGNYSYAVYDRLPPHRYRGSFIIGGSLNAQVDGAEETDGLDVASQLVTPDYPEGILVVQDGFNTLPARAQNFKFVSWRSIRSALAL